MGALLQLCVLGLIALNANVDAGYVSHRNPFVLHHGKIHPYVYISNKFERAFCQNGGQGKPDGKYAHPKHCDKYIECYGYQNKHGYQKVIVETCPYGLFYSAKTDRCDWPCNVECFLYQGRTCYGAEGEKYGAVKSSHSGYLRAMKLIHVDGYLTCKYYKPTYKSFWGCNTKVEKFKYKVNTWVTTEKNLDGVIFPNYKTKSDHYGNYLLEGYSQASPYLKWYHGPEKPTKLHRGQQMKIWYGEDLLDIHEFDNEGKHCVDVYALFSYFKPYYYMNRF